MTGASSDSYLGGLFRTRSEANFNRHLNSRRRYYSWQIGVAQPPKGKVVPKPSRALQIVQVAELLSEGLEFDQIADCLGISVKAVRRHFDKICKHLGPQAR